MFGGDLVVTNSGTPNPVVPGGNITYTQTVNNNGPQPALNVVFSEAIPTNTTFVSLASPAGWTCSTPAVGAGGNISCTLPSNDPSVLSTFTLVVQVGAGTPSGTTISDTDSVSSGVNDTNLANNTATVNTLVAIPSSADISVTNSAAPSTVAPSANITYTQSITNNGPSTATTVSYPSDSDEHNFCFVGEAWDVELQHTGSRRYRDGDVHDCFAGVRGVRRVHIGGEGGCRRCNGNGNFRHGHGLVGGHRS